MKRRYSSDSESLTEATNTTKKIKGNNNLPRPSYVNEIESSPLVSFKKPLRVISEQGSISKSLTLQPTLQHEPIILLFYGCSGTSHIKEFEKNFLQVASNPASIYTVTVGAKVNEFSFPQIDDHDGSLIRELRAVHPLGGGKMPMDAIAIIDTSSRKRLFSPIGLLSKGKQSAPLNLSNMVKEITLSLEYLQSEKILSKNKMTT